MGEYFGNLILAFYASFINLILLKIQPILSLVGLYGFTYDIMNGAGLYPEMVVSHEIEFN